MNDSRKNDPRLASIAIQTLRMASEKIPMSIDKEGMGRILKEVTEANETISKCEKSYQEQADVLNSTIAHSISSYVDRELLELERNLRSPIACNPSDPASIDACYQTFLRSKEKLSELFSLVSSWGWSHFRQSQLERIAELFEMINGYSEKIGDTLLQMAHHLPTEQKGSLIDQQARFLALIQFGSDEIKPDQIFSA